MFEVGVEPTVEDRVSDRAEHGEGVNDKEKGQLNIGFNHRGLLDDLKSCQRKEIVGKPVLGYRILKIKAIRSGNIFESNVFSEKWDPKPQSSGKKNFKI